MKSVQQIVTFRCFSSLCFFNDNLSIQCCSRVALLFFCQPFSWMHFPLMCAFRIVSAKCLRTVFAFLPCLICMGCHVVLRINTQYKIVSVFFCGCSLTNYTESLSYLQHIRKRKGPIAHRAHMSMLLLAMLLQHVRLQRCCLHFSAALFARCLDQ